MPMASLLTPNTHLLMIDRPSVLHPHDPASAPFDFLSWRITRRFVIDRLCTLAVVAPEAAGFAELIEAEALDRAGLDRLQQMLRSLGEAEVASNDELFLALDRILERHDLQVSATWHLPAIRPDWSEIPLTRALFTGEVDGVRLTARLDQADLPVPPYVLVWTDRQGREGEPEAVNGAVGEFLPFAAALWDWLLARRLTLLCAGGFMSWPAVAPLVIEPVAVPARGF